jgi:transcriptional regulator with XRE-family HTH domain
MIENNLASVIKHTREIRNISQRELARRTKLDNAEISRIEKGKRLKPGFFVLKALSDELEIDLNYLMILSDYDKEEIDYLIKHKDLPKLPEHKWDDIYVYSRVFKDGPKINIMKIMRDYKRGRISEFDFIEYLSMALGVKVNKYIFEDESKTISYDKDITL